tara:strand:- start:206 stop:577 length:372 start_codon:yes stop_codon:yes gene_type:complete
MGARSIILTMEETKIYGVQWKSAGSYSCEEKYFTNKDVAEKFSTLLKITSRVDDQDGVWGPYEVKPLSDELNEVIKEAFGYDSEEEWILEETRFDGIEERLEKGELLMDIVKSELTKEVLDWF